METVLLTTYVLVWPVTVAAVLWVITKAFVSDWRQARRDGRDLV